jgi:hypothetical protein
MKFNSKLVVLAVSLLVTVSAFAGEVHKASLQTLNALQVNGTSLPAGDYQLRWEGNGPNVQLNILKGNKVVTTTDAHVIDLAAKSRSNAAVTNANPDGSRSLSEIRMAGKKFAFALGNDRAQMKSADTSK